MRESVNNKFPLNAYRKIIRLQKKNTCMDEEFPYSEGSKINKMGGVIIAIYIAYKYVSYTEGNTLAIQILCKS